MLPFVEERRISIYLWALLLACICIPSPGTAAESRFELEDTTEILKLFVFTDKEKETGDKWDVFIKERTRFSNTEYQTAIRKLKSEFDQSYANLDKCIRNTEEERDKYSSSWLKDLQDLFGKEYIKKNMASIRFILLALPANSFLPCEDHLQEALYREYCYLEGAKDYVHEFLGFSETLDKEGKKKLAGRIMASESYLKSFKYPLHATLSEEGLRDALYAVTLKTRNNLDPSLIDFFTRHTFFRKPFALHKALDDLKALK